MKPLIVIALFLITNHASSNHRVFLTSDKESDRIVNGRPAVPGQIPYQIALNFITAHGSFWCGGSLIGSEWILTAAHCVDGAFYFTVYLGTVNISSPHVIRQANSSSATIHPGYNRVTLENDIALLRIPAVQFSKFINIIRIPGFSNAQLTFENERAITAGWGKTRDQDPGMTNTLRWANVTIGGSRICTETYTVFLEQLMICVPTPNAISNCQGDSGGPLVIQRRNLLVGVFSFFSPEGCERSKPVVFTRVTSYLRWIRTVSGIHYA